MDIYEERVYVAEGMVKYGGGFMAALGEALFRADLENTRKIKATWPEDWETYLNWGKPKDQD